MVPWANVRMGVMPVGESNICVLRLSITPLRGLGVGDGVGVAVGVLVGIGVTVGMMVGLGSGVAGGRGVPGSAMM